MGKGERESHQDRDSLRKTQGKGKGQMALWTEQESKWLRSCPGGIYDQPSLGTDPSTAAFSIPSPGVDNSLLGTGKSHEQQILELSKEGTQKKTGCP